MPTELWTVPHYGQAFSLPTVLGQPFGLTTLPTATTTSFSILKKKKRTSLSATTADLYSCPGH
jgi:hypothetical protein